MSRNRSTDLMLSNDICWFCNNQQSHSAAKYKFFMNRDSHGKHEVIAVYLGRCRWCKKVHRQQSILTWVIFLVVLFGIRFLDSVGISEQFVDVGFSVLGAMLVFKKIWSDYFRILHSKWVGIKSATTEDISDHPEIFTRRYTNWHFGQSTV